jgi:hypothetical protein
MNMSTRFEIMFRRFDARVIIFARRAVFMPGISPAAALPLYFGVCFGKRTMLLSRRETVRVAQPKATAYIRALPDEKKQEPRNTSLPLLRNFAVS